ncbi:hypothetical protein [Runella sp.]|uniref:hypothetical protein n=1 Tax=Runella sp. TaxID=1960881 RepID=UPI0030177BE6
MFDFIDLNPETQSELGWIFLDAVLCADFNTDDELNAFVINLNADWLIISKSNTELNPETCLIKAIGDVLQHHINSKEMAESCHKTLTLKWFFHRKYSL